MVQKLDDTCNLDISQFYSFGNGRKNYVNYTFSLVWFTYKLFRELQKKQVKKVFFLAREGEFLKKLYDGLCYVNDRSEYAVSEYLYVSRQSTFAASLNENIKDEDFSRIFNTYESMSVTAFLKNLTFTDEVIEKLKELVSIDFDLVLSDFRQSLEYKILIQNEDFCKIYRNTVENCKQQLINYLKYNGFYLDEKVAIVDVGWRGSIQDNIFFASDQKITILGYYIGLTGDVWTNKSNQKKGLLFADYPIKSKFYSAWSFDSHFFERILTASHPSTRSYKSSGEQMLPVFNAFGKEKNSYIMVKPLQDEIYRIAVNLFKVLLDNEICENELEKEFLRYHISAITDVDADAMEFQAHLLKNQEENFGCQISNAELFNSKLSSNSLLIKARKIKKLLMNPMLFANVLRNLKLYTASAILVRAQKKKILKQILKKDKQGNESRNSNSVWR